MAHDAHSVPATPASGSTGDAGRPSSLSRRNSSVRLVSGVLVGSRRWRSRPVFERALLPVIGADDVVLPAFEEKLGEFARRAQAGDVDARDALFFAFQPKLARLMRVVRPPFAPTGSSGVWDRDDVGQEAYLVFIDLVLAWPGDVPLTAYLMSRFPWRLKDTIRRGVARSPVPPHRSLVPIESAALVMDESEPPHGDSALLESVAAQLPSPLDAILIAHVLHGKTKTEIAAEIGVSRRTMVRYWKEAQQRALVILTGHEPSAEGAPVPDPL
jgi:RNA polymerase sigma factor (sigma-70 family)